VGRERPRITVVGLGPAGPEFLTGTARALVTGGGTTFLRTARHPAAAALSGYVTFDAVYESAATFDEVYATIVDELVEAASAQAPEPVTYAVPGSPLVAERTVELLRRDPRVDVTVVPALSFLDLAWERLGIDPLGAGVRLVDAEQFAGQFACDGGPHLVAQCWSQDLLSEIKLSTSFGDDLEAPDVVLLSHLGLPDEQVVRVGWWDLDRTLKPDHLTSLYIPALPRSAAPEPATATDGEMARLEELVATLRAECPWDRVQTHASLMPHLLEESYEVLDALRELDAAEGGGARSDVAASAGHLEEELGDLLFQVVFHARLAEEAGRFTLADVARGVHDKLVHRHPHVFEDVGAHTAEEVRANWEEIKREEKGRSSVTEGIPLDLPALLLSTKLQKKALSVGMSGPAPDVAATALEADVAALLNREADPKAAMADPTLDGVDEETARLLGDVLFGVADVARRLGIDPELALRRRALAFRDGVVAREVETAGVPIPDEPTH
jgi:tetrapyrrole methylase family protein / MazG family protein